MKKPLIRFVQVECEGLTDCPIKIAPAEKDAERKANTQASGGTNPKRGERDRGVCGGLDAFRPHQELGYLNCALTLTNAERSDRIGTSFEPLSTYHVKPLEALPELKSFESKPMPNRKYQEQESVSCDSPFLLLKGDSRESQTAWRLRFGGRRGGQTQQLDRASSFRELSQWVGYPVKNLGLVKSRPKKHRIQINSRASNRYALHRMIMFTRFNRRAHWGTTK